MGDILLPFESEGFLIASAAAKGDDDSARAWANGSRERRRHQCRDGRGRNCPGGKTQKFAAIETAQLAATLIEGIHCSSAIVPEDGLTLRRRHARDKSGDQLAANGFRMIRDRIF
jgi:hypothetical protein